MPSLSDIPEHLLHANKYADFLNWLLQYPLGWNTVRATVLLWARAVNVKISARSWAALEDRWIHRNVR